MACLLFSRASIFHIFMYPVLLQLSDASDTLIRTYVDRHGINLAGYLFSLLSITVLSVALPYLSCACSFCCVVQSIRLGISPCSHLVVFKRWVCCFVYCAWWATRFPPFCRGRRLLWVAALLIRGALGAWLVVSCWLCCCNSTPQRHVTLCVLKWSGYGCLCSPSNSAGPFGVLSVF